MDVMDARRLELYDLLKPKLEEEAARKLVLALGPAPDELVTKDFLKSELRAELAEQADKMTWRMILVMGAWTAVATSLYGFMAGLLP